MLPMPRLARPLVPLLALALSTACSSPSKPSSGRDVLLVSESVDRQVGADIAAQIAREMGIVDKPALGSYVQELGQRVARQAPPTSFKYRFTIVDQDAPNAFALPGGFIYISRGLLELSNSEDELANVLGHEVMHVAARHAAARQQIQKTAVNPFMLPGVVLGAVLGEAVGRRAKAPFSAFNAPYVAAYGREQERAADRGGQQMAARAGYDPGGMAEFLQSLGDADRHRSGYSRLPTFLDSHPATQERVNAASSQAGLVGYAPRPGIAKDRNDYLRRLDGLVAGKRAAEGHFRGDRFYHPELDFTIKFPTGWKRANADTAVGAISPRRDVQIFLSAPTPGNDPRKTGQQFLADNEKRVRVNIARELDLVIGELPAYRIEGTASASGMRISGQVTWIAYKDRVYRLTAVTMGTGKNYLGRAQNTARSFRPLTREECASIQQSYLRLVTARGGENLSELGERSGNAWTPVYTGVINDLRPGAGLEEGRLVKIAVPEPYRSRNGCRP